MIPLWPRVLPIRNVKHRQNPVTVYFILSIDINFISFYTETIRCWGQKVLTPCDTVLFRTSCSHNTRKHSSEFIPYKEEQPSTSLSALCFRLRKQAAKKPKSAYVQTVCLLRHASAKVYTVQIAALYLLFCHFRGKSALSLLCPGADGWSRKGSLPY